VTPTTSHHLQRQYVISDTQSQFSGTGSVTVNIIISTDIFFALFVAYFCIDPMVLHRDIVLNRYCPLGTLLSHETETTSTCVGIGKGYHDK
jgi:hypothetical protein